MNSRFLQNIGRRPTLERLLGPPLESLDIASFTKQLLNVRYRVLLVSLSHALSLTTDFSTRRGTLVEWCFNEMSNVAQLMSKLNTLPLKRGVATSIAVAGAPFELPYTLALPDRGVDRQRLHDELLTAGDGLIKRLRKMPDFSDEGGVLEAVNSRSRRSV
jgi:hypothetical protein